jgi:hypothetical protein
MPEYRRLIQPNGVGDRLGCQAVWSEFIGQAQGCNDDLDLLVIRCPTRHFEFTLVGYHKIMWPNLGFMINEMEKWRFPKPKNTGTTSN